MGSGAGTGADPMSIPAEVQASGRQHDTIDWVDHGSDFILIAEGKPPSRIALARERMLIRRLYVGLLAALVTPPS
jgi:hypothetical protein